jgi:MoxR-like ATPase
MAGRIFVSTQWSEWLSRLSPEQVKTLKTELIGASGNESSIEIVRSPTSDYLVTSSPPFVDVHELLPLFQKLAFRENLLIKGPKGDGKSLALVHFAAETQSPLITVPCSEEIKKKDLVGAFFMRGKDTPFLLGAMATAIDIANECGRCILAFEEVNALTPQTQKQLNEFLDFRKSVSVPQIGKTYRLREGCAVWIVGLMNPSLYGGTHELNEDFRSRWVEADLPYPEKDAERAIVNANLEPVVASLQFPREVFDDLVEKCVQLAAETRNKKNSFSYSLSPRDVVSLVRTMMWLGPNMALQLLSHKFEGKDHGLITSRIGSTFKNIRIADKWGSDRAAI